MKTKMNETEKLYRIALTFIDRMGPQECRKIIQKFGSARSIFLASEEELVASKVGSSFIRSILSRVCIERAEKEMQFMKKNQIHVTFFDDGYYPEQLKFTDDGPFVLYYKGQDVLRHRRMISIVGTRNATSYGRKVCQELVADLKAFDPVIVSGMAYGIDCYVHQAAVENGIPTIGVLGHGLDMVYPEAHTQLARKMLENGGLLTEFPSETMPLPGHFPMRNRIIAGMSQAVVVVEAGSRGGALITADLAYRYNHEVFAFPGNIYDEYSKGCNSLIQSKRAVLIRGAEDIASEMMWESPTGLFSQLKAEVVVANPQESEVLDFLTRNGPATMDKMADETGMNLHSLSLILLQMELKKLVSALPGKVYTVR